MRKRLQIALAVLLVAVVGMIAWQVLREREPVYKGKPLSVWLAIVDKARASGYDAREADAIRHIGTNALPMLLETLRARDTTFRQVMMTWAQKQKLVHFNFTSADQRRHAAMVGYAVLGPLARAQVPCLIDTLTNDPSPNVRQAVAIALGFIGPEARMAGPALFRATKDTDPLVRNNSFWALSRILPDPQLTIPVLIAGLDDPLPLARESAAIALGRYGQQAKAAVPALLRTLETNRFAGFNLKKIDPEAAAKAGVK